MERVSLQDDIWIINKQVKNILDKFLSIINYRVIIGGNTGKDLYMNKD